MLRFSAILLVLFFCVISQDTVCNISTPISLWLKDTPITRRCHTINGHFILDKTANRRIGKLFAVFSNLTRIDGCIYVNGFSGSKNLSFFSNLEDVTCDEDEALRYNLTNVIYVLVPKLKTMGFNSLKNVTGPGEVYLSYEEEEQRDSMGIPDGEQCFSKEEMIFLSYHSQFRRKMYPNCETEDPCFRLDTRKQEYFVADIPDNCTVFAGLLCIIGPYEQEEAVMQKFKNLAILIGQLQVMGTLLDRLDTIFPKLQVIYPYQNPNAELWFVETPFFKFRCMGAGLDYSPTGGAQYVHVGLNRFLSNMSIPSLLPIRPIDVSLPILEFTMPNGFKRSAFLPERLQDHCSYFPQFNFSNCGAYLGEEKYPDPPADKYSLHIPDYLLMVYVVIGVALSIRTIILLSNGNVATCLPYSRYLIIILLIITTLIAIKNSLISQKVFGVLEKKMSYIDYVWYIFLSEFSSVHLTRPLIVNFMRLLAAAKHVCLIIIIACYLDAAIYYRIKSSRISKPFCVFVILASTILCVYFNSQLYVAIRGRRPNYLREPRHIVFMPFIMTDSFQGKFEEIVPSTQFLKYEDEELDIFQLTGYTMEDMPLDDMGTIFPTFSNYCDAVTVITVILFYLLRHLKFTSSLYDFNILILLYIQLSINRIRHYLYSTILMTDYCTRSITELIPAYKDINCYVPYDLYFFGKLDTHESLEAFMDEWMWNVVEWIIGNLPSLCYPIVSFYCWRFAMFHNYLGALIRLQMKKESLTQLPASSGDSQFEASDVPQEEN